MVAYNVLHLIQLNDTNQINSNNNFNILFVIKYLNPLFYQKFSVLAIMFFF